MYHILKTTMRYSPEHKKQTRDRILKAASRRFRSRGSEGAAISDLMKDLRLTHGGFYKHFDSKESLFLEAFTRALDESKSRADAAIRQARPGGELKALIDAYLDVEHCRDIANGCRAFVQNRVFAVASGNHDGALLRSLQFLQPAPVKH